MNAYCLKAAASWAAWDSWGSTIFSQLPTTLPCNYSEQFDLNMANAADPQTTLTVEIVPDDDIFPVVGPEKT
jgi:hypothetical protein